MGNSLIFDIEAADKLGNEISSMNKDMRRMLKDIRGTVSDCVKREWEGASAQAFTDLYDRSSENVLKYLKTWLENSTQLLKETTKAKNEMDVAEAEALKNAAKGLDNPV